MRWTLADAALVLAAFGLALLPAVAYAYRRRARRSSAVAVRRYRCVRFRRHPPRRG